MGKIMNKRQKTVLAFVALAIFVILAVQQLQGGWTTTVEPKLNFVGIQSVYTSPEGKKTIFSREDLRYLDIRIVSDTGMNVLDVALRFNEGAPPAYNLPSHAFVEGSYAVQGTGTFVTKTGEEVLLPLQAKVNIGSEPIASISLE